MSLFVAACARRRYRWCPRNVPPFGAARRRQRAKTQRRVRGRRKTLHTLMSKRSQFTIDDDDDARTSSTTPMEADLEHGDDKTRLLDRFGGDEPPEHAVGAYEQRTNVEVGPGVDADESDLVDDIFDNSQEAKANANSTNVFCRCNLASSILLIASMSLLTYSMVNPSTRDAVTKFALTSTTERHKFDNVKVDPKTGRPTVELMEAEDEAMEESERYGDWYRLESLKGSESPSRTHNQWDLSGLMMYEDDDCTKELSAGSFELASESATHSWQKRAEKGWGYLSGKEGVFIHEPLIGGSRVSAHLEGVPRCVKISTCYPEEKLDKKRDTRGRRLLQTSEEAEALADVEEESNVCDDTHFPSTLALYRYVKNAEEWMRASTFAGTGVSDDVVDVDGVKRPVRTFKFINGELSALGNALFLDTRK